MHAISRVRFNALAGYCRHYGVEYMFEELDWFEHAGERVLGIVAKDREDGDFVGGVLGRDRQGRFRMVSSTKFESSQRRARVLLRREVERFAMATNEEYYQGDENSEPVDFFKALRPQERLHPNFLLLSENLGFIAARDIITPMMHWYEDPDGNFIEQFQTTGFDARLWELYLFAAFREMGYIINRCHAVPDFTCKNWRGEFSIEAVTVNPTLDARGSVMQPPDYDTPEALQNLLEHYMPTKFSNALTKKLSKEYWKEPNVAGKPLIFAIQDFSYPGSMTHTRTALPTYLYGYAHDWYYDAHGQLCIVPRKLTSHRNGNKDVPSGFFFLPNAENISAVVYNNSATLTKFNRMGVVAGFGSPRVHLIRVGNVHNHDPNAAKPMQFCKEVNDPHYSETWVEGLDVYHNPRAKQPLDPRLVPGAAHHRLTPDGQIESVVPDWHPLSSITQVLIEENFDAKPS